MAKRNGSTPSKNKESTALQKESGDFSELMETTPFGLMRRFSEEMDRLFGGTLASRATDLVGGRWSPQVEMFARDNNLVVRADLHIVAVDAEQADLARSAWRKYGKGRHTAALNFGDCFSYALAKSSSEPLLAKGTDFASTDIVVWK